MLSACLWSSDVAWDDEWAGTAVSLGSNRHVTLRGGRGREREREIERGAGLEIRLNIHLDSGPPAGLQRAGAGEDEGAVLRDLGLTGEVVKSEQEQGGRGRHHAGLSGTSDLSTPGCGGNEVKCSSE